MIDVLREDRRLYSAGIRHFRKWSAALRAAGIDHESVYGRRTWTAERVCERIRELDRAGVALNCNSVKKVDSGVVQAARKRWGSWDAALTAAGFDPQSIRQLRPPWTKSALVQAIQAHVASGATLTEFAIRVKAGRVAKKLFGSFDAALVAAGVLHLRRRYVRWSLSAVREAIRTRQGKGEALSCKAVIRSDWKLYSAGRQYYGGWPQALRAAGVDPDRVRRVRSPWTREDVLEELRRRVAKGLPPTYVSALRPVSLVKACVKFFGSWEDAAVAAGVDPARIGYYGYPKCRAQLHPKRGPHDKAPQ